MAELGKLQSIISPKEPPATNWVSTLVWFIFHSYDPCASPDLSTILALFSSDKDHSVTAASMLSNDHALTV